MAGIFFAYKCAGAAAEAGGSLREVAAVARAANENTRTMGVGLSPTILPDAGEPTFTLAGGEMEIGIGIHGEPGVERGPLGSADEIADHLVGAVLGDLGLSPSEEVAVMVNGLGATPPEELYVLYRRVGHLLGEAGASVHRPYVGEYATSAPVLRTCVCRRRPDRRGLRGVRGRRHARALARPQGSLAQGREGAGQE